MRRLDGGFTLIEAMVGSFLLCVTLLGVVAMMGYFATGTSDTVLRNCLLDNALSGLKQLNENVTVSTAFTCANNVSGTLSLNPNAYPATNTCSDVTATATGGGRTLRMTSKICNFQ